MSVNIRKLHYESDKILSSLSATEKDLFLSQAEILVFKKNKLIFYEGGIPTGVFLMKKGKAKIYKTGIYDKEQIFYIYNRGDLFGYHALLCDEKYEDSCEALEDCEVLFIDKYKFDALLNKIKNLKTLLLQNMSHEFGVLVNTITILAQKNVRERLAIYLMLLHDRFTDEANNHAIIDLPREDFANMIGTARESLSRLLREFKEDGYINISGRKIEVLNSPALLKIANGY